MKSKWWQDIEREIRPYTSASRRKRLHQLMKDRIKKGLIIKWSFLVGDFIFVALIFILIGVFDILNKKMDLRLGLITGIIAFGSAILKFSPIKGISITKEEVNDIFGPPPMAKYKVEKIRETVEQRTSGMDKWLIFIGACGVLATVILKFIN